MNTEDKIRDARQQLERDLKQAGRSSSEAEAAGRRLAHHLGRRADGAPVDPRPSILNERRR